MKIWIASVSHRHGGNVYAATTRALLEREVARYCREWWKEIGDDPAPSPDMTDDQIISTYFDAQEDEFLEVLEETEVVES